MKYAVALNNQGLYAPTEVGDFRFLPDCKLHVWKGTFAFSVKELADQVNAATEFLANPIYNAGFTTLRVVEIDAATPEEELTKISLIQANEELREIIRKLEIKKLAA